MNIHEHQAKELLRQYGIPTPAGIAAFSVREAGEATEQLPGPLFVVKAQIHAGGRGKGKFKEASAGEKGGVRLAKSRAEVHTFAEQMLGATLVTAQTGADGRVVNRIYVSDGVDIERELYLSALVDRASSRVAFVASAEGGVDIEKVAHDTPEKIVSVTIDPASGYQPFHGRRIAFAFGLEGKLVAQCVKLVGDLYNLMLAKDMSMLEINPLIVTKDGSLSCLDAKMSFDSNALYRHPDIVDMRDLTEEAVDAAAKLGGSVWAVKSQIHAGGRGKGKFKEASAGDKGGVRIAKSVAEVNEFARQMLGATLVTIQTGPQGKQVNRLYIEEGSDIDKEFYLSILVDRETSEVSFVVSTEGGVNIEEVAHNTPEKIVTFSVDPATGIMAHHGRTVAKALNLSGDLANLGI